MAVEARKIQNTQDRPNPDGQALTVLDSMPCQLVD